MNLRRIRYVSVSVFVLVFVLALSASVANAEEPEASIIIKRYTTSECAFPFTFQYQEGTLLETDGERSEEGFHYEVVNEGTLCQKITGPLLPGVYYLGENPGNVHYTYLYIVGEPNPKCVFESKESATIHSFTIENGFVTCDESYFIPSTPTLTPTPLPTDTPTPTPLPTDTPTITMTPTPTFTSTPTPSTTFTPTSTPSPTFTTTPTLTPTQVTNDGGGDGDNDDGGDGNNNNAIYLPLVIKE